MLDGLAPGASPTVQASACGSVDGLDGSAQAQAAEAQMARCERLSVAIGPVPAPEPETEALSPEQQEELEEYARYYGIDPQNEQSLLWIAREGMEAPLPDGWNEQLDERGVPYYYETATRRTQWKHPYDDYFKDLVRRARKHSARHRTRSEASASRGTQLSSSVTKAPKTPPTSCQGGGNCIFLVPNLCG